MRTRSELRTPLVLAGLVVLSVLLVGSLWIVPYLPTNDGPEWVFAAQIENHYGDPAAPYYARSYVPALQFASRAFMLLYAPLHAWLGWQRGLQLAQSVLVLVVAWGFVALVRAIEPRRLALGFLGFPLALSWTFYMGFWAFALSLGGGLLLLALVVKHTDAPRPPVWLLAVASAGLLVLAVGHVFAAGLTGIVLALLLVANAGRGRRLAAAGVAGLVGAPAAGLALASVLVAHSSVVRVSFAHDMEWLSLGELLRCLPQTLWPGPMSRALVGTALVGGAAALVPYRLTRADTPHVQRGLAIAALLFLGATVASPVNVPGWQCFQQRFATPAIGLAFALVPLEALRPRARRAAEGLLFCAVAGSLALSYPMHRRLASLCADSIAGLFAPVRRSGVQLPVAFAATDEAWSRRGAVEVPMLDPLSHMGALYAAVEGGLIPYAYASSAATHPFTLRPGDLHPPIPSIEHYGAAIRSDAFRRSPAFWREVDEELAAYGMRYEGVVLLGARPADHAIFEERGFVADWARGATFLGHFEPCGVDVAAPAQTAGKTVSVDVGWGQFQPIDAARVDGALGPDGLAHYRLPQAPCGQVRVRARWSPEAPGAPWQTCAGADDGGFVATTLSRSAHEIACGSLVALVDSRGPIPPNRPKQGTP